MNNLFDIHPKSQFKHKWTWQKGTLSSCLSKMFMLQLLKCPELLDRVSYLAWTSCIVSRKTYSYANPLIHVSEDCQMSVLVIALEKNSVLSDSIQTCI